jgi:20S proteasome alpha/beta subunit
VTVVVAFVGPDGAVMASDSEGTGADQTRHDVEDKVWSVGGMLFGYSGTSGVRQPVEAALAGELGSHGDDASHEQWNMRATLCAAILPVLRSAYASHVPAPPAGQVPQELKGTLVAVGRDPGGGYWLLEIDHNNQPSFYTSVGFHAIGSGSTAAQVALALMKNYEPLGRNVAHLRLMAYRTIKTCIDALGGAYGIGGEVRIWQSENGGPFTPVEGAELEAVKDGVDKWTTIERESLDRVALDDEAAEAEEAAQVELPEVLEEEPGDNGLPA